MSKPLAGKVALVTGASRGLGRASAEALARDGAAVIVHYGRNHAAAEETVAAIKKADGAAFAVQADLAETGSVAKLFAAVDDHVHGARGSNKLDIVVNNAGIAHFAGFADTTEAMLDETYAVNVKAPFLISQEAAKRLNDGGRIINFSTVVARLPMASVPAYSALKASIDILTKALAAELGPRGITVNAVAPGAIDTDMAAFVRTEEGAQFVLGKQALKRIGKPEDIADVVAFLAGPQGRWVTGQVIEVSGGSAITF